MLHRYVVLMNLVAVMASPLQANDKTLYNVLSTPRASVNIRFKHTDFMTAGFTTIETAAGRRLHIGYDATRAVFVNVTVVNGTDPTAYKAPFSMVIDDVSVALADRVATITTPEWTIALSSKFKAGIVAAGNTCAEGKCFLELKVSPRVDVAKFKVAPHGLIGQTYDGDSVGVIGKTDDYKTRDNVVTASAIGEGAVEGEASDYEMASKYATDFKFSRWGKVEAKPRDVSQLTGQKVKSTGTKDVDATEWYRAPECQSGECDCCADCSKPQCTTCMVRDATNPDVTYNAFQWFADFCKKIPNFDAEQNRTDLDEAFE